MRRRAHYAISVVSFIASGCAGAGSAESNALAGTATLLDPSGLTVGTAEISPAAGGGVRVRVNATALAPGNHGIHVHETGACDGSTSTPFSSARGHLNPTAREHGRLNPAGWHAGDLPNLVVDAAGTGTLDAVAQNLTLSNGSGVVFDADGSAIVVHANPDDERTNDGPSGPGNSGARIACGVIVRR